MHKASMASAAAIAAALALAGCQPATMSEAKKAPPAEKPMKETAAMPTGELGDWLVAHSPCAGEWRYSGRYCSRSGAYNMKFRKADGLLVADIRSHLSSGDIATGTRSISITGADKFEVIGEGHSTDYTRQAHGTLSGVQQQGSGTIVYISVQCSNVG